MKKNIKKTSSAFSLIELLVVISIMGILLSLSIYGTQEARKATRDGQRKSNLEQIRSGLEMYKADCNNYPTSLPFGSSLVGSGTPSTCSISSTYISQIPNDPLYSSTARTYVYYSDGITYQLCAAMEQGGGSTVTCGSSSNCGGGSTCNYQLLTP